MDWRLSQWGSCKYRKDRSASPQTLAEKVTASKKQHQHYVQTSVVMTQKDTEICMQAEHKPEQLW